METKLAKWGNSFAVRLPKEVVAQTSLNSGDKISVSVEKDGGIVLRPKPRGISLAKLVEGITSENQHSEASWGRTLGKEAW